MSNQFLKLRRSAVPGRVPSTSSIDFGEIALNTYDGLAFIKRSGSLGEEVITLGSREGAFTGSFSGSFIGNGAGLFNVPASGIVGLNLSQIATGSVSASVGVGAASFNVVSGSNTFLYVSSSGNVGIGTNAPSNVLDVRSSLNAFTGIDVRNSSSGNGARSLVRLYNDNGNIGQLAIFGSGTGVSYANKTFFEASKDFVIGTDATVASGGTSKFQVYVGGYNAATSPQFTLHANGNLSLGATSDSSNRLQVYGTTFLSGSVTGSDMLIRGSGATSATTALTVQNSSITNLFVIDNAGTLKIGTRPVDIFATSDGSTANVFGRGLIISTNVVSQAGVGALKVVGTYSATSGADYGLWNSHQFVPTSGSATHSTLWVNPTINQTGGANGITRGLYVNPTLTSAADWRAIEWSNNSGWGLYGAGSAPNYLSGSLNIGTTTLGPNILNVNGTTSLNGNTTITGSLTVTNTITAQTLVVQTITSSTDYVSGSTIFGNSLSNTHQFTGSVSITGSLRLPYLTDGSVLFISGGAISQNNSSFFWDAANSRLGIGTNAPSAPLNISVSSGTLARFTTGGTGNVLIEKIQTPGGIDGPILSFARADGTFPSSPSNVQINRGLGVIDFYGYFTGAYRAAGSIKSFVDGTASSTSMPMRLEFLTSTDGTITPTVKMMLKNNGNLLLQNGGTFNDSGNRLQVYGTTFLSGSVTGSDMLIRGSGNTSGTNALAVQNSDGTALLTLRNDGLLRLQKSYLNFSSDLNVGIGASDNGSSFTLNGLGILYATPNRTSAGVNHSFYGGNITNTSGVFYHMRTTGVPNFAPTSGTGTYHILSLESTINQTGGANGITRGLYVNPTLTANADFRAIEWSNNVSGSTSWGLYGAGNALNFLSGRVSIGSSLPVSNIYLSVTGQITGGVISYGVVQSGFVRSDVTIYGIGIANRLNKSDSNTLPAYYNFAALGGGSISGAVTNEYGFVVGSGMTSATSSYGFYGDLASGTGRWNLYMNGTANNYLAGALGIGVTSPTTTLDILGNFKVTPVLGSLLQIGSSTNTSSFQEGGAILVDDRTVTIGSWDNNKFNVGTKYNHVNNSEALDSIEFIVGATTTTNGRAMFISSSGNVGINTITPAYKLDINGDARINNTTQYIFDTSRLQISTTGISGFYGNNFINWASSTSYTLQRQGGLVGIRINSTDNVSIGATTDSGHKLQVYGNTFISGTLDILDAEINYQRNNNVTTGSARLIASIPTASLNAAFFDYVIVSGSNARAGTVMSVWASSSVEWNETYTNDIGSTTDVSLYAAITGSSIGLFATSSINTTWTIKSLIRTI